MQKSVHTADYRRLRSELRRTRTDAGLSQRDLAERLGVPHSWVAKVESGERRLDLIEFCWFIRACGAAPRPIFAQIEKQIRGPKLRRRSAGGRSQ